MAYKVGNKQIVKRKIGKNHVYEEVSLTDRHTLRHKISSKDIEIERQY